MAMTIATCSHILLGGYDLSAYVTGVTLNYSSEGQDATTMGHSTRKIVGGLKTSSFEIKGYLDLGSTGNEPVLFGNVGVDDTLVTAFVDGVTVGSTVETGQGMGTMQGSLQTGTNIGALVPFDIKCLNGSLLVKASVLEDWRSTDFSTGDNDGTPFSLGAAATSEQLYGGVHITAFSTSHGASVTAKLQAASSSGTGWTTVGTFTALSSVGGAVLTPVTPNNLSTDQTWWRSVITVSTGTSTGPTSRGLVWMSIQ